MKKIIALVSGGYSGERVISERSALVVGAHLDPNRFETYHIIIDQERWVCRLSDTQEIPVDKNDFSIRLADRRLRFDAVFMIIHGTPGEDGKLQGYFDMLGIPYNTCDAITMALTFNKAYCNKVVSTFGVVDIAPSFRLCDPQQIDIQDIASKVGLPCFVKPNAGGSSLGTSKVKDIDALEPAIRKAFEVDTEVLVERFIQGREFSCGAARLRSGLEVFPVTEIISKNEFFDYEAKYTPGLTDEVTPALIEESLKDRIQDRVRHLYGLLNCKGIVRIDFIWESATDTLYFLEINTVPGQSEQSIVPNQIRAMGRQVSDVYGELMEMITA